MWRPILLALAISGFVGPNVTGEGVEVSIDQVPYQLGLEQNNRLICGGSIIDEEWALTAAHCVTKEHKKLPPEQFQLRFWSDTVEKGGGLRAVKKIFISIFFNEQSMDEDVALLQVDVLFPGKLAITLAQTRPAPGRMGMASGWGGIREGGPLSEKLRWVQVPIVDQAACKAIYAEIKFFLTNRMLCAGFSTDANSGCEGDHGGPLVVDGELVGIFSKGNGCVRPQPAIYADVAKMWDWIVKKMNTESVKTSKK